MVKIGQGPVIGGVTSFTGGSGLNMTAVLTGCYDTVMAGFTTAGYAAMVKVGYIPGGDGMTGITLPIGL